VAIGAIIMINKQASLTKGLEIVAIEVLITKGIAKNNKIRHMLLQFP
jgi:hypothetical protein